MKKRNAVGKAAICVVLSLLLAGCADSTSGEDKNQTASGTASQSPAVKEVTVEAKAEYPTEPEFKSEEERHEFLNTKRQALSEDFTEAYHDFAMETSAELFKGSSGNMVYSPLSLYYALALACNGAEGDTQEEMLELLGYDEMEQLAADCKESFEKLYYVPNDKNNKPNEYGEYAPESRYTLKLANSLWVDDAIELKDAYTKSAAERFYADMFKGDLQSAETAAKKSQWVSEHTNGLLTPSEEPANAQAVLSIINTVYFYDEWITNFQKEATAEDQFTLADGSQVTCDFMNRIEFSSGFRRGENYTASSMALKNGRMTFVLPNEGTDVHDLVKDEELLEAVLRDGGESLFGKVTWKVPKFSYGCKTEMADMLKTLGMEDAFSGDADFSNMTDSETMFISDVMQNAHLGIDENGVEAAAFTEILFCGAALPKDEAEMILDRPFLYAVEHNGQILFIGICENPSES